jgi:V-type H+-transporting ATPase subunit C
MDEDERFQQGNFVDFTEIFKTAARERRFIVREYTRKAEAAADPKAELADLEIQVAEKQAGLERWCRTHYGEAFGAWVHLKVVRAFVESVLRYGLSPMAGAGAGQQQSNFMLAALKVNKGRSIALKVALDKMMHVDTAALAGDEDDEDQYSPYCKLEFMLA